jgi:hypothetical protein
MAPVTRYIHTRLMNGQCTRLSIESILSWVLQVTGVASHVEYKDAILKASNTAAVRQHTPA